MPTKAELPLRHWIAPIVVAIMLLGSGSHAQADLRAGAARVSITPDPVKFKYPLGGYVSPNRIENTATGILDICYARALVLDDGKAQTALISLDLCFLPANVVDTVAEKLKPKGFVRERLFISATHSHSALDPLTLHSSNIGTAGSLPKFRPDLLEAISDGIALSVSKAQEALQPAKLGMKSAAGIGLNRARNGNKITDDEMTVLTVTGVDAKPIALLFNYAAHPVYFGADNLMVSGDWCGAVCRQMEANTPGQVCLFFNGAEGDASPHGSDEGANGEKILVYAAKLQAKLNPLIAQAQPHEVTEIKAWRTKVNLPKRQPHPLFLLISGSLKATPAQARELVERMMPESIEISWVQLGKLVFVGFPGEPTAPLGLAAKAAVKDAGIPNPIVVALTNGWLGYLLMSDQYRMGRYESTMSFYGEEIGTRMLDAVRAGIKSRP